MMRLGMLRGGPREGRVTEEALAELEEVLVEAGGKLAGRLAALTAPLTRAQGERAVARDVATLFGGKARVARLLKEESPGRAAAWLEAIERGAPARRLNAILKGTKLAGTPILSKPDEGMHRSFLRKSRRRRKAQRLPKAIVRKRGAVERFLKEQQGQVGTARKGWDDASRALGGQGAPWAARGATLGGARVTRTGNRVRVEITNRVRYARFLMGRGRRERLVREAREKAVAGLRERQKRD